MLGLIDRPTITTNYTYLSWQSWQNWWLYRLQEVNDHQSKRVSRQPALRLTINTADLQRKTQPAIRKVQEQ